MRVKSLCIAAVAATFLSACGPAAETDNGSTIEADETKIYSKPLAESDSSAIEEPTGFEKNMEGSDTVTNGELADAPTDTSANVTDTAGTKPKSKFITTYDEKRKKSFIPKCEREMAQDLKPDQVGEACNCLFEESAKVLVGIKERLNPPADKLEAVNEKCLTKYL